MYHRICLLFLLGLVACSSSALQVQQQQGAELRLQSQRVYVVPFETLMVPPEVTADLFNRFVDRLNQAGAEHGHEFVILKQGL